MSTGYNLLNLAPFLATTSLSTAAGFLVAGPIGAVVGLGASLIDEFLINYNIEDKHYAASSLFWSQAISKPLAAIASSSFPAAALPLTAASYALSAIIPYFTDDFLNFHTKLNLPLSSLNTLSKLFDETNLIEDLSSGIEIDRIYNKFYENPLDATSIILEDFQTLSENELVSGVAYNTALSLVNILVTQIITIGIAQYIGAGFSALINSYQGSTEPHYLGIPSTLIETTIKVVGLNAFQQLFTYFHNKKERELFQAQLSLVTTKTMEIITNESNGRKILSHERGKEIVENLENDLWQLLVNGVMKLTTNIEESVNTLKHIRNLQTYANDALPFYIATVIPTQIILSQIADKTTEIESQLSESYSKLWSIQSDLTNNIEQIILRDGGEFTKEAYNKEVSHLHQLKSEVSGNQQAKKSMTDFFKDAVDTFIDVLYFGNKVFTGHHESLEKYFIIKDSITNVLSFFSSNINFVIDNKGLILAKERLDLLFKILETELNPNLIRGYNADNTIIIKNYKIELDNKIIVQIDYLEFKPGNHYAVTGKSGCGKTSTLIDLKEGLVSVLKSSGEMYVGDEDSKIMFINQDLYLPPSTTLFEAIYFPKFLDNLPLDEKTNLEHRILDLFKEIEIDAFATNTDSGGLTTRLNLDDFKLSGGQKKKISIIQAIIFEPDILIMDETFTGLDAKSLINIQKMLGKYLHDTTIISVDHHACDNNYNGFYDKQIHFKDYGVVEEDILPKTLYDDNISVIGHLDNPSQFFIA